MKNKNYSLLNFWAVFFLFLTQSALSQENKLIVNYFGKPVDNLSVKINEDTYITKEGAIHYFGSIKKIVVDFDGYYFFDDHIDKDGIYIINLTKEKLINEINIKKKDSTINTYSPKREKLSFVCKAENKNLAVLNYFELTKRARLKNYSFFIMSEKKYCVPFNFVVYKKDNDVLTKTISVTISEYGKNNNTVDLFYRNLVLDKGEYFFVMEWIINETELKDDHGRATFGQDLGGNEKDISNNKSYFLKNNKLIFLKSKVLQQLKIQL